ncbi:hypothetical protein GCM10022251_53950 [Phytohabitans flavus]|uniref:Uncharacterized protein n=1 Tax=Phytohabitans flavus TaxID=1076124 RepID=A0A6F8XM18_9ACTN|nr:hypothetical protein [Phytohabitans flavus]BCB74862.1 hypothetical protein Pflav_012720 [Phytohabitans flavus]
MPDWRSRLAVSYVDEDGNSVDVTPIDAFSPSFSLNAETLHSIEQTHIGVVYTPQTITFSMTVRAIGDAAAKLTLLALQGKRFNVTLQETDDGDDWSFDSIVLSDCIITSATPSPATISGAPAATFSGMSLGATVDPKAGETREIP